MQLVISYDCQQLVLSYDCSHMAHAIAVIRRMTFAKRLYKHFLCNQLRGVSNLRVPHRLDAVQGYLAHKKRLPRMTLQ